MASFNTTQFTVFELQTRPPWCEKSKQATCPTGETCCKTKITKVEIVPPNTKCGQNRKNFECTPVQVNTYYIFLKSKWPKSWINTKKITGIFKCTTNSFRL